MTEHTALPWSLELEESPLDFGFDCTLVDNSDGYRVDLIGATPDMARHLLTAANYHHRLVEALRYAVDNPEFDSEVFDNMCRALLTELEQTK